MRSNHTMYSTCQTKAKHVQTTTVKFACEKSSQTSNDKFIGLSLEFENQYCYICGKMFPNEPYLQDHKKMCHETYFLFLISISSMMSFQVGFPSSTPVSSSTSGEKKSLTSSKKTSSTPCGPSCPPTAQLCCPVPSISSVLENLHRSVDLSVLIFRRTFLIQHWPSFAHVVSLCLKKRV
jgi:hypothetical protein